MRQRASRLPSLSLSQPLVSANAYIGARPIADALQGAAFFNWANRLMLSLGEPQLQVGG